MNEFEKGGLARREKVAILKAQAAASYGYENFDRSLLFGWG